MEVAFDFHPEHGEKRRLIAEPFDRKWTKVAKHVNSNKSTMAVRTTRYTLDTPRKQVLDTSLPTGTSKPMGPTWLLFTGGDTV